jgi:L-ascorbate metabolism protein UlaG (beta-lactamase superfamily)
MKVTFIGHASLLVESNGISVLSDPWWQGPCFGAQWWTYPTPNVEALDGRKIDYIYISHGHHDHLHPGTLATLPKTAKVLVSREVNLASAIRDLGFEVIEVTDDRSIQLGNHALEARILRTHGADTLIALSDGNQVCINLNDALHAAPTQTQDYFTARLREFYPTIDYVYCGYGVASHFPNCYRIPGKNAVATARQRQQYFSGKWARLIAGLQPKFGFPFAADVVFLQDDLFWANEATHNGVRPTHLFETQYPKSATRVIDIAPGFVVNDGQVQAMITRRPLDPEILRNEMRDQVERANRLERESESVIAQVVELLNSHLQKCHDHLAAFPGDYKVALRFVNSTTCVELIKCGTDLALRASPSDQVRDEDLTYVTRWAYMRWALTRPYGDELLFVGSGGVFEYANREAALRSLHREIISLIRNHPIEQRDQSAAKSRRFRKVKQLTKQLLGRSQLDLYDLMGWTVFTK